MSDPRERFTSLAPVAGLFFLLLAFHLATLASDGDAFALPGQEYRQARVALSALFVERDQDFSPAYPTPLFGPPWSVPFEFPLYPWLLAMIGRAGWSLADAGRLVSGGAFYLSLIPLWLLLARIGLPAVGRWLTLALVVTSPLYVFHARAVVPDLLGLLFGLWFLYGYVRTLQERRRGVLVLTVMAGAVTGLVEPATLLLYGTGALVWTLLARRKAVPSGEGGDDVPRPPGVFRWATASLALPALAAVGWQIFAAGIRSHNPLADSFGADALARGTFGAGWMRPATDASALTAWTSGSGALASVAVLGLLAILAVLCARRWWPWIAGAAGFFAVSQLLLPVIPTAPRVPLTTGIFLLVAGGITLTGLWETTVPRWRVAVIVVGLFAGQVGMVLAQREMSPPDETASDISLGDALRQMTASEEVLFIVADPGTSRLALLAERRALLAPLQPGREWELLEKGFDALAGHPVGALVLRGQERSNRRLLDLASERFDLHPAPALEWRDYTVYLSKSARARALQQTSVAGWDGINVDPDFRAEQMDLPPGEVPVASLRAAERRVFADVSPKPAFVLSRFGLGGGDESGRTFINAHPEFRLSFLVPAGRREISAQFRVTDGAWEPAKPADWSDGVEFVIYQRTSRGEEDIIFRRLLDPARKESDRGTQRIDLTTSVLPDAVLCFETRPGPAGNYTRDWAQWGPITIR